MKIAVQGYLDCCLHYGKGLHSSIASQHRQHFSFLSSLSGVRSSILILRFLPYLSAYNLFFKEQRTLMLAERARREQQDEEEAKTASESKTSASVPFSSTAENGDSGDEKSRRESPGRESKGSKSKKKSSFFGIMAQTIAKRWKEISKEDLARYEREAAVRYRQYREGVDAYKRGLVDTHNNKVREKNLMKELLRRNHHHQQDQQDNHREQDRKLPAVSAPSASSTVMIPTRHHQPTAAAAHYQRLAAAGADTRTMIGDVLQEALAGRSDGSTHTQQQDHQPQQQPNYPPGYARQPPAGSSSGNILLFQCFPFFFALLVVFAVIAHKQFFLSLHLSFFPSFFLLARCISQTICPLQGRLDHNTKVPAMEALPNSSLRLSLRFFNCCNRRQQHRNQVVEVAGSMAEVRAVGLHQHQRQMTISTRCLWRCWRVSNNTILALLLPVLLVVQASAKAISTAVCVVQYPRPR